MGKLITDLSSVTTVGLDLAKRVFQVHCVDASGRVLVATAIRRKRLLEFFASLPACLVGLEQKRSTTVHMLGFDTRWRRSRHSGPRSPPRPCRGCLEAADSTRARIPSSKN
jgi:transposase